MNGFDGFIQKRKHDRTIYTEQKQRGIPQEQKRHATVQGIYEKYDQRMKEGSTFEQRSQYYFRDSEMLRSKAQRYKTLATSGQEIRAYSAHYRNHGTDKRKKYARKAAENFEKAAALEDNISGKTKGFELYKQRNKVMRLRMEGMVNAAMLKSKSDADETYRILKAKYSCLTVMMDQLQGLQEGVTKPEELASFEAERVKLEQELAKVKKELTKNVPSTQHKFEREHGLDGNRDKKNRAAGAMNLLQGEGEAAANCILYSVRRDRQGQPIDRAELKKDNWNREYRQAVQQNDAEKKNRMMREAFARIGAVKIPGPAEVSKKGILNFYEQDPGTFADIVRFAKNVNRLRQEDPAAEEYMNSHPELAKKAELAGVMAELFSDETRGIKITRDKKSRYQRIFGELHGLEQEAAERQAAGQQAAVAPVQEENQEKKQEEKYSRKLAELRKTAARSYSSQARLDGKVEKLMKERLAYYEGLIDQKVQDENARQYYRDLANLVIQMDRRSMGLEYMEGTEDLPDDQQVLTDKEITRLMKSMKDNNYRTGEARQATDQLFADTFVPSASQRFRELLEERESHTFAYENMNIEAMEDTGITYAYSGARWMYQVDKKTDQMGSLIGGIKAAKKVTERLGLSDMLPKVEEVVVKDAEGGEHLGVRYRKKFEGFVFKGEFEQMNHKEFSHQNVMFTPEALKQLSAIRLMQYLMGDPGYNSDDGLFFQTNEMTGSGTAPIMVTAVRSDIFGGGMGYRSGESLVEGEDNLPPLDAIHLPILDRDLVDQILDMKEGEIREIAGDLINSDKARYFDSRLRVIQKKLRELKAEDAKRANEDKVLFQKEDMTNPEKLRKLEERLQGENAQMYPTVAAGVHVAGASHGIMVDEQGEDQEMFNNKLYFSMKEYVTDASTPEEQVKRVLDMYSACNMTEVFGDMTSVKSQNASTLTDRIMGEVITKELMRAIQKGWLDNKERLLQKYREVAERLKDTPVPEEYKDEDRSSKYAKEQGDEKMKAKEKEHYIYYVVAQENPALLQEYVLYEGIATTFAATRFVNRTADADFEEADALVANISKEVREENPNMAVVKEKKDDFLAKLSLIYNSNTYLINAAKQDNALQEFREQQKNLGKDVARRILGEDMVP